MRSLIPVRSRSPKVIFRPFKICIGDFINDEDTAEPDESRPQKQLSWKDLPDREEGFGQLLAEILKRSLNSGGGTSASRNVTDGLRDTVTPIAHVGRLPMSHDFPLWRVACRVSLCI